MFHNVLMTSLTALRNTDEINSWENRPFTTIWPEDKQSSKCVYQPKSPEINKTIKKRPKRVRTAYTTEQLGILEQTYLRIKYINAEHRKKLSHSLKLSEKNIKVWFQNRRMKEKKETSESSDSFAETSTIKSDTSPSHSSASVSPGIDGKSLPEEWSNEVYNNYNYNRCDNADEYAYQLPNYNFYYQPEYQSVTTPVMPVPDSFTTDTSAYPTSYYPTLQDYFISESYRYNNENTDNLENQWSASNFDLNYFQ